MSDSPTLLATRAAILSERECETADFANAAAALRTRRYDLIIFCQTVPESLALELLAIVRTEPQIKVLTILTAGDTPNRAYETEYFTVDFLQPGRLRDAVAALVPSLANTRT